MSNEITISGLDATVKRLDGLSSAVQNRLVDRAGRAALKPIVKMAKENLPAAGDSSHYINYTVQENSGQGRESIGIKKSKRVPKGEVVLSVGPRKGFDWVDANGKKQDPFKYLVPYEYGHVLKFFGKPTGTFIPPAGFMRRAYESGKAKVVTDFAFELNKRIEEHLKRGA